MLPNGKADDDAQTDEGHGDDEVVDCFLFAEFGRYGQVEHDADEDEHGESAEREKLDATFILADLDCTRRDYAAATATASAPILVIEHFWAFVPTRFV